MKALPAIIILILTLISAAASALTSSTNVSPRRAALSPNLALIYKGPGACDGCPEAVADRLQALGFTTEFVGERKPQLVPITKEALARATLYVQPGGSDILRETLDALTSDEKQNIRDYVRTGGAYLGLCAGGYLAGKTALDEGRAIAAFDLIDCFIEDEDLGHPEARTEELSWFHGGDTSKAPERRALYFQDGPQFCRPLPTALNPRADLETKIYALYSKTNHIAAMITPSGQGRVGVIGPHPEADESWYAEDHLATPTQFNFDLFDEFVRDLTRLDSSVARSPQPSAKH